MRNVDLWSMFFSMQGLLPSVTDRPKHPHTLKTGCHNMSTDLILFYSKQPPPGIFCALPPIVPMVRHGSSKPWEMLIFGLCFFNAGSLAISE